MIGSIFFRLMKKVVVTMLIAQAGCDAPSPSPVPFRDCPETEEDSLIPPLFTKTNSPAVSITVFRKGKTQVAEGYGFADKSVMEVQVDFPDLCNRLK